MDIREFYDGNCFDAYEYFGAHKKMKDSMSGYEFKVFAPNAEKVELVGEFNQWIPEEMKKNDEGIHSLFVCNALEGQMYKYLIKGNDGESLYRCDPFGFQMEVPPQNASIITDLKNFYFSDEEWINNRSNDLDKPLNIYEIHFGSWRKKEDDTWYSYSELAKELIPYLKENKFTHVELLPLTEHPLYASWGYQVSCYFSLTSRYGTPKEFMEFVNECHRNNIGVIIDFVPVHFVSDNFALSKFDGTPLYEYGNDEIGYSQWGTCNFNYYKNEVRSFLNSAANFLIDVYHIDGLRMDAISDMLYWHGDSKYGENEGAVKFIKNLNKGLNERHKNIILIAEDASCYPKVTSKIEEGGLGFNYKWDMGWMNDTLNYFKLSPKERIDNYNMISFSMWYFYAEKFMLTLSHDEVVHGKATIMQKMWGDYDDKFKQCKTLFLYMFTHPGKKLNFMGNEFGQLREWDENRSQDWELLKYPKHDSFKTFFKDLSELYLSREVLYKDEYNEENFKWLTVDEKEKGIFVYRRGNGKHSLIIALNTSDSFYENFKFAIDEYTEIKEIINSDSSFYGGNGVVNGNRVIKSEKEDYKNKPYSLNIMLAPFSSVVFEIE